MTIQESWDAALEQATPLDTYRAISLYEDRNRSSGANLGISTELFDGGECVADVELFVESSQRGLAVFTSLGLLTVSDGINVDGLADLYARRGSSAPERDHDAVVSRLMRDGYLAVAVSQTARRGITAEFLRHRYEWWDEDAALRRAIGRAGIDSSVYERNNYPQRAGGIEGRGFHTSPSIV